MLTRPCPVGRSELVGEKPTVEDMTKLFSAMDEDGSGELTTSELRVGLEAIRDKALELEKERAR